MNNELQQTGAQLVLKAHQQAAQDVELPEPFRKQGQQIQADGDVRATCDLWCREQVEAAIAAHQARQVVPQVIHQHGFAGANAGLRAVNESLDKQLEEVMAERDARDDVLARIAGLIDAEFTSAYGFSDLESELEERLAAAPQPTASKDERVVLVGSKCPRCVDGVYRLSGNGYAEFARCDRCHAVPTFGEYDAAAALSQRPAQQAEAHPVVALILAELERATRKFPTWPTDPLHALAVLGEEFGETTKAMLQLTYEPHKTNREEVRTEAIQTAAMALRLAMSLDAYVYAPGEQHSQQDAAVPQRGGA